jgi:hypothetical protein
VCRFCHNMQAYMTWHPCGRVSFFFFFLRTRTHTASAPVTLTDLISRWWSTSSLSPTSAPLSHGRRRRLSRRPTSPLPPSSHRLAPSPRKYACCPPILSCLVSSYFYLLSTAYSSLISDCFSFPSDPQVPQRDRRGRRPRASSTPRPSSTPTPPSAR